MRMKSKGQAHIMEYFILSFFVMVVIVLLIIFITTYQIGSSRSEQSDAQFQKTMFMLKTFSSSPLLNKLAYKEGSMLEDSKLTALSSIPCSEAEGAFGQGWFAEVKVIGNTVECTRDTYPNCGIWSFCRKSGNFKAYDVPVNIYRKTTGRVDAGMLTVGYYG